MGEHGVGGVGLNISSEEEVRSGVGRVGLGVGQVVLVVLGVVGGHLAAQLQSGLHERVHGSHGGGFSPLLPAHLRPTQALPGSHDLAGVSQTSKPPETKRVSFLLSQHFIAAGFISY